MSYKTKQTNQAPSQGIFHQKSIQSLWHCLAYLSIAFLCFVSAEAYALGVDIAPGVTDVAENIVDSTKRLPTAIAAISYLVGMFFGATGLLKLRNHVEAPTQTPISAVYSRLLIGGALLSLPIIYEVIVNSISAGGTSGFDETFSGTTFVSALFGKFSGILGDVGITRDLNAVFFAIIDSVKGLPSFISALAYIIGIFMGFTGLLKLRDHMEDPDRNPLKEALLRFFIGACMLSLPTIYSVMARTIAGDGTDILSVLTSLISTFGFLESTYSQDRGCTQDILTGALDSATLGFGNTIVEAIGGKLPDDSLGTSICRAYGHAIALPSFLSATAKLLGLYLGFDALLKLRDHIANPQQTPASQSLVRFLAGGCFLALDNMIGIVRASVMPAATTAEGVIGNTTTKYVGAVDSSTCSGAHSLKDQLINGVKNLFAGDDDKTELPSIGGAESFGDRIYCAVTDVLGPLHSALNFFTFCAGVIFIMIGISRLLKSEQDGARGPVGMGTFFTFVTGGLLLSFSDFIKIINMSLFNTATTKVGMKWAYDETLNAVERDQFYTTLTGIIKFMIIIGLISFARGLFIIRNAAEGNGQASIMAGATHLIAGSLAINIGPLLNLVQKTLGIESGITFQ